MSLGRWRVLPTPRNLVAAGALSGYMGTLTSVGSPPIGLVYQNMPGPRMRATVSAFFMLGAGFSIVTLAAVGRFTLAQVVTCAWLLPPVVLGFLVGIMTAILGTGGAFLLIPAKIYLLRMRTTLAVGTSQFQMCIVAFMTTFIHAATDHTVDIVLYYEHYRLTQIWYEPRRRTLATPNQGNLYG